MEILGPVVVAAMITAIVTLTIAIATMKREDSVRAGERETAKEQLAQERLESRAAMADERAHADAVRASENQRVDTQRQEDRDLRAAERRQSEGVVEAKVLLQLLADMQSTFDNQRNREHGTYSLDQVLNSRIYFQCRLVPHSQITTYVSAAVRIITETWVLDSVGEIPEGPGTKAQREVLKDAMDVVTEYIRGSTPGLQMKIDALASIQNDIDAAYKTYHAH